MKINKDGIAEEDKEVAVQLLNSLRRGNRVLGNPSQGLQITLRELEEKKDQGTFNLSGLNGMSNEDNKPNKNIMWELKDKDLEEAISKLKAGIEGEKDLADFLARLFKYNDDLSSRMVAYASLSQEQESNNKDYIPDSDFLLVHNDNFLIIDAKNISTNPKLPIHFVGHDIETDTEKPKLILEGIHSSVNVWKRYFDKVGVSYNLIKNVVCIVNKVGAYITEPLESDMELIHIAQLNDYLMQWIEEPTGVDYIKLYDLVQLSKCEIRKEKSDLDLSDMKRMFKV